MKHTRTPLLSVLVIAISAALCAPAQAADLIELYELARASDPQLQAAESAKFAAGEGVVQSRSTLLPRIAGSASYTNSSSNRTSVDNIPNPDGTVSFGLSTGSSESSSRSYGVSLNQTIYNHANFANLKASKAQRSRAESDYQQALQGLYLRVSTAYFSVLTFETNFEAAEAEEKAVARQLEQAEQRHEVGLTAITDVHEARARYDSSRASVIQARNSLQDAYEALTEITGQPVDNLRSLREEIPLNKPTPNESEAWVETALLQNPAIESQRKAVSAAEYGVSAARAGHLPTLNANAGYNDGKGWGTATSGAFTFPSNSFNDGKSFGVTLNVPLFEGFATQSRVRQAIHNRDASEDQLEQQRRAVTRQTRTAFRAITAGTAELEARKQAKVSAQSALDATQAGFEVGTRTIVDVLQSQQQLYAAQREYARSRHEFILNGLRLKQSAGVIDVSDLQEVNSLLK